MIPLLADPINDAELGYHLLQIVINNLIPLLTMGLVLWNVGRAQKVDLKQPFEVELKKKFPSREEFDEIKRRCDHHDGDLKEIRNELKRDKEELLKAGSERGKLIYERLNGVIDGISKIGSRLGRVEGRLKIPTEES